MTTRLSDRHAEVDRRYIQMEHHRATLTAAQDAAEQAARACKNNYDTTTDMVRAARQELKEFAEALRPWRKELLLTVFVVAGLRWISRRVRAWFDGGDRRVAAGRGPRMVELMMSGPRARVRAVDGPRPHTRRG